MMKRCCGILAMMLLAGNALAAEPVMGFYAGAGVGNATLELADANSFADFEGDDTGFRLIAGYRLFRYFAIEANYTDYGDAEDTVLGLDLQGSFSAFHVSAVGLIPLGPVDLFGKAGIARWEGSLRLRGFDDEFSEDNVDPIIGLGAQWRVGQVTLRGEMEGLLLGFDDDGDDEADGDDFIDFLSLSPTWAF